MRRNYGSFRKSGAYTSPGTPEHCEENVAEGEIPKTWSSERVPLPTSTSYRRPIGAAALMPFNNSGRAFPSKWDDAERWITSPISGYGAFRIQPHQRRSRSKSGPLGQTGLVYMPNYSLAMTGNARNFTANSPLTTGVFVPDAFSVHYEAATSNFCYDENNLNQSTSTACLSDLISEASVPNSPGNEMKAEGVVLCRDVATQMSPEGSACSSSCRGRLSFSNLPSTILPVEKDEVRDVQVDEKGTTTARQSKKWLIKGSTNIEPDFPSHWNVTEASKNNNISKLQREELKITAWENLQKARAEAAIRKLEQMKLEKKRSASMDKITNKLRAAQMKAQAMRDSVLEHPSRHSCKKSFSCCIYAKKGSIFDCSKSSLCLN